LDGPAFSFQFSRRLLKPRNLYTERSRGFENPLPRTEVQDYTTDLHNR
jgi:hypothetical protein